MMKKSFCILSLICALFLLMGVTAFAKTRNVDICSGDTVEAVLEDGDTCRYNFESDEKGYVVVKLLSVSGDEGVSPAVKLEILRNGVSVTEFTTDKPFVADKYTVVEGIGGGTISVKVTNATRFYSVKYSLSFEYREYNFVENEVNNTPENATSVELAKAYTGGVYRDDSEDWFSFEIPKDGYINLSMCCDTPKLFSVFDESLCLIGTVSFELEDMSKSYEQRIGLLKGKYYLRVMNYDDMTLPKYTFRISAGEADNFEAEPNGSYVNANEVQFSKTYNGNLMPSDEDYYVFNVVNAGTVTVKFTDTYITSAGHYSLYIIDENGKVRAEKSICSTTTLSASLEPGKYYFKVICPADKYYSGAAYYFRLSSDVVQNVPVGTDEPVVVPDTPDCTTPIFSDVQPESWYYDVVCMANSLGLVNGVGDGLFDPDGNVTIAQAITMAAREHNEANDIGFDFEAYAGDKWYSSYVLYAVSAGIIKPDDFNDYNAVATRAQMAYIFANVIGDDYKIVNDDVSVPDVDESIPYAQSIFKLYRAGVLEGNDESGTFSPDSNITRAQSAAILVRIHSI